MKINSLFFISSLRLFGVGKGQYISPPRNLLGLKGLMRNYKNK